MADEEIHLIDPPNLGHIHEPTCWCEPKVSYWRHPLNNHTLLLVWHVDHDKLLRQEVTVRRTIKRDAISILLDEIPTHGLPMAYRKKSA
jgi:hypothetical protein